MLSGFGSFAGQLQILSIDIRFPDLGTMEKNVKRMMSLLEPPYCFAHQESWRSSASLALVTFFLLLWAGPSSLAGPTPGVQRQAPPPCVRFTQLRSNAGAGWSDHGRSRARRPGAGGGPAGRPGRVAGVDGQGDGGFRGSLRSVAAWALAVGKGLVLRPWASRC